jgi:hypothetical protein
MLQLFGASTPIRAFGEKPGVFPTQAHSVIVIVSPLGDVMINFSPIFLDSTSIKQTPFKKLRPAIHAN